MEEVEIKLMVEIDPSTKQYIDKQIAILDRIHSMREESEKKAQEPLSSFEQLAASIRCASHQNLRSDPALSAIDHVLKGVHLMLASIDRLSTQAKTQEEAQKPHHREIYRQLIDAIKSASMRHPRASDIHRADRPEL